ncbi:Curli production assembly/transport component CsgG [Syntrophobacter sp. SbD1]|nr:Curli production assembly/transport component CsgG [Syntrophobacter sp. SbD1]
MKQFVLLVLLGIFLQGCATLDKSDNQPVTKPQPQISPTLTEASPKRFLKRKVAIARFSNETKYGQSFFYDANMDPAGKQAMDIISAKLAATDKFILLERADLDKIGKEIEIGDLKPIKIPADYLIIGSVSEFGRKDTGEVGVFSRTKKQTAYAKVNVRLVDVHTAQIIYSEEGEGEAFAETGTVIGVGGRAGYDSTLNDKAISAAISQLVNNVISNLLNKPWRSYVLACEGGQYIIAGGKAQGLLIGDQFTVYKQNKKVKNPQTGMMIELPGQPIGEIQVTSVTGSDPNNEVSLCTKVSGNIPTSNLDELYIQEAGAL